MGGGKLETTLALELYNKGLLSWLVARNPTKRNELQLAFQGIPIYDSLKHITKCTDVIFITVSDNQIEEVAVEVAQQFCEQLTGTLVIHCSGTLLASVLQPCENWGAYGIAAHPFETFAYSNTRALVGIAWGIECLQEIEHSVHNIVRMLGGNPVTLGEFALANKALYHISAVISSNYLTSVLAIAKETAIQSQIEPAVFLPPIIRTTVENSLMNIVNNGTPPLTGPISRGDVEVVTKHLQILDQLPSLQRQYCYLGLATSEFAFNSNLIDNEILNKLKTAFLDCLNKE